MAVSFESLAREAERRVKRSRVRTREPYVLTLSDGTEIKIPYPDAIKVALSMENPEASPTVMLRNFMADDTTGYRRLMEEIDATDQQFEFFAALTDDMWGFWGIEGGPGKSGQSQTS